MAIAKKPKAQVDQDSFIKGAPDSGAGTVKPTGKRGRPAKADKKIQITLTIAEPTLKQVDELAQSLSLSRAAVINLAIHQGMSHGISVDAPLRNLAP